jgi:hypothetical protein
MLERELPSRFSEGRSSNEDSFLRVVVLVGHANISEDLGNGIVGAGGGK